MASFQPDSCKKLVLPFLNERDYLQGTTLFSALWHLAASPRSFVFKVRRKIFSNCVTVSDDPAGASCELLRPAGALYMKEAPPEFPPRREKIDEASMLADFEYLPEEGYALLVKGNNLLPVAVASFKHFLLARAQRPSENEHWAFVGLRTQNWPEYFYGKLVVNQIYSNSGRAKCVLNMENAARADMYFSLAPRKNKGLS